MPQEVNLLVSTEGLQALADMAIATKEQARLSGFWLKMLRERCPKNAWWNWIHFSRKLMS